MKILKSHLRTLILTALTPGSASPIIEQVYIENGAAVSTNGHVLFTCELISSQMGSYYLSLDNAKLAIKQPGKAVDIEQYIKAADDKYPQWRLLIPDRPQIIINGITSESLIRCANFKDMPGIRFSFSQNRCYFTHRYGGDSLECKDDVGVKTDYDGKNVSVNLSCKLLGLARYLKTTGLEYNGYKNQVILFDKHSSARFLIMSIV